MSQHTFHIPVMGTGFSIDTPVKVARYGISSVISLVDDTLIEQMREYYCTLLKEPYIPIAKDEEDYRARRITAYLNLIDRIVKKQFEELKASAFEPGTEITKYFELLPDSAPLKAKYGKMLQEVNPKLKLTLQNELRSEITTGKINVNIMTKVDRINFDKNEKELPVEFSDALSALRGYAMSTLDSAIVFSAGINRRLYTYAENFKDFYADAAGEIKKKIVLKVSDFRSALTQGKFFAKKGLWVSEYRIESGLNCGGHVFPAAGELMGPIMEEFKVKRQELITTLHDMYDQALKLKNKISFPKPHPVRITAQGGIGTATEDKFVRENYQIDSTGWGSPFLLVPEATNVDEETLQKLANAGENDIYTSEVSPLGVPFNNLRGSLSDAEKDQRNEKGRPGSSCPKGHLVSNTEFTPLPICTASRLYQKFKIDHLRTLNLESTTFQRIYDQVTKKACICNDLGEGALLKNSIAVRRKLFPAVCPGPNIAYFSKIMTLADMVSHIYGRANFLNSTYRPHMFIKELQINIKFFEGEIKKFLPKPTEKQIEYLLEFRANLIKGINYYRELFPKMCGEAEKFRTKMLEELEALYKDLENLIAKYTEVFSGHSAFIPAA
ncbi:MAG: hypothetical protein WC676_05670 [Candidatus Omnitrophota bacterium]